MPRGRAGCRGLGTWCRLRVSHVSPSRLSCPGDFPALQPAHQIYKCNLTWLQFSTQLVWVGISPPERSGEVGDAAERTELAVPARVAAHPELQAEKSSPPPQLRVIAGQRMLCVCSCHRAASLQAPLAAAAAPCRFFFFSMYPGSSDGLQAGCAAAGRARGRGKANRARSVKVFFFFPCFCVSCPSSAASLREVASVLGASG